MPEPAEDTIVRNLIEALERLREDLDRVELWAAALGSFQHPVPDYQPGDQHLLSRKGGDAAFVIARLPGPRLRRPAKRSSDAAVPRPNRGSIQHLPKP